MQNAETLGVTLIVSLAEQLGGKINFKNSNGACTTLEFIV
jgi:two-component sensor histidine kinase